MIFKHQTIPQDMFGREYDLAGGIPGSLYLKLNVVYL